MKERYYKKTTTYNYPNGKSRTYTTYRSEGSSNGDSLFAFITFVGIALAIVYIEAIINLIMGLALLAAAGYGLYKLSQCIYENRNELKEGAVNLTNKFKAWNARRKVRKNNPGIIYLPQYA